MTECYWFYDERNGNLFYDTKLQFLTNQGKWNNEKVSVHPNKQNLL